MRRVWLAAWLSLASVTASHALPAQLPAPPAAAVTVDVTVVDRTGRSVTGLTIADFQVELDKQPRPILALTYLPSGAPMTGGVGPMFDAVTPAPAVYRLAVSPPDGASPGSEFAVAVSVSRPGARVQTAPRAIASRAAARAPGAATAPPAVTAGTSVEEQLRHAIATGRQERALPIRLGRALRRAADRTQVSLDVQIEIPATARPPLSALLGVVDGRGAIRSAGQQIAAPGDDSYRLDFSLPLAAGPYKLRFAVSDAGGTIGAIETPVSAELAVMGPFAASDLLRWTSGAGTDPRALLFDELPAGATTLGASLELYGTGTASGTADVLVRMTLGPAGTDQPPSIERIVTPESRDGALVAEAEFPLERVARGNYILRAVVQSGATVLGTASAAVVKR